MIFISQLVMIGLIFKEPYGQILSLVEMSVRLFTFEVSFKRLFAPTSWNRMSTSFKDSESLGKSNEKSGFGLETIY